MQNSHAAHTMTELVTILVGLPCTGKTSYLKTYEYDFIVSSDSIVEILCRKNNISYGDYFNLLSNNKLKKQHQAIFNSVIQESKTYAHVVWDLTNLTKKSRASIYARYPHARFQAINFHVKEHIALLLKRNRERFLQTGKYISDETLLEMAEKYEQISDDEPIAEKLFVDSFK